MPEPERNEALIAYFSQPARVACDRQCHKAWGINNRPRILLDPDNPDDYVFLADGELAAAPADPGTYEGGQGKPSTPDAFPNKWCVRECERCALSAPGESALPLALPDYSRRLFNLLSRREEPNHV